MNNKKFINNFPFIYLEIDDKYIIQDTNKLCKFSFPDIINSNILNVFSDNTEELKIYLSKVTQEKKDAEHIIVEKFNKKFIMSSSLNMDKTNNILCYLIEITSVTLKQNLIIENINKNLILKTKEKNEQLAKTNKLLIQEIEKRKAIEEELKLFASTDALTNIYNRRSGRLFLEHRCKLSNRDKTKFVICFADVNGLKIINDTYGHNEGDELIITISNILRKSIRESDFVFRLGGDEFIVVFINTDLQNSAILWDRINFSIKLYNSKTKKPYKISVSHGFAEYNPEYPRTIEQLIAFADEEMYKGKDKYYQSLEVKTDVR